MKRLGQILFFLGVLVICPLACGPDTDPFDDLMSDGFDRKEMLVHWADNVIIPAFASYAHATDALKTSAVNFGLALDEDSLLKLKEHWLDAVKKWQGVSMFDIGMAEQISLRDFSNIYPVDVEMIENHISTGQYNLELPSTRVAQGLQALDYLLYANQDIERVLADFDDQRRRQYLQAVVERLDSLAQQVLDHWQSGYREAFISTDGSSATSSVDKLTNDFLFYFEKFLRAGKVGIPAGVFSNTVLPDRVEGYYSQRYSRSFTELGLNATVDFFIGKSYDGDVNGPSLEDYINHVTAQNGTRDLTLVILEQWDKARQAIESLDPNLTRQIENNNVQMLKAYDELQKAVVLLKVEMLQALNIQVDFVDADGD